MKKIFQRPKYLKKAVFHYCPGCGHSIIHRLMAEIIEELDIGGKTIGVPPAGCAVLAYNYFDVDMAEAAHGRGAAVATGIKRVLPDRVVFTYQGDGDIAAIGTAETIHAANRGEKIAIITKKMMMIIPALESLCLNMARTTAMNPTWDFRRGSKEVKRSCFSSSGTNACSLLIFLILMYS